MYREDFKMLRRKMMVMAMAAAMMAGCGSKSDSKTADGEKSYTIGISQFAEHGSLDNCREGFLELSLIHI